MDIHQAKFLFILITFNITSPLIAQNLHPYKAEYSLKVGLFSGKLTTTLNKDTLTYTAISSIKATGIAKVFTSGIIKETSIFNSINNTIRPNYFSSNDEFSKNKGNSEIKFDWNKLNASVVINNENTQFSLNLNTHDRVSLQYALMLGKMNNNLSKTYLLQDGKKLKNLNIKTTANKKIKTNLGIINTEGVEHFDSETNRRTTFWLSPVLDYTPVVIEQSQNNKIRFRAILSSYEKID